MHLTFSERETYSVGTLRWLGQWKNVVERIGPRRQYEMTIQLMSPAKLVTIFPDEKFEALKRIYKFMQRYERDYLIHIMQPDYKPPYPKEIITNTPVMPCGHCATPTAIEQMTESNGQRYCSNTCRAANEIFQEWMRRES